MAKSTAKDGAATPTQGSKRWTIKDLATAQRAIDNSKDTKDKLEKLYDLVNIQQRLIEQLTLSLETKVVEADIVGIKERFTHIDIESVEMGKEEYDNNCIAFKLAGADKPGLHDAVVQLKRVGNKGLRAVIYHPQREMTGKEIDQTESHGAKKDKKKPEKQSNLK